MLVTRVTRASLAFLFAAAPLLAQAPGSPPVPAGAGRQLSRATFAGGCFWCMEAPFEALDGVVSVTSGYTGGSKENPTYEEVSSGRTGHAEAVQVTFDPSVLGYADLLELFFAFHDPTTLNRQGPDTGTQYRSAIFVHTPEQKAIAEATVARLTAEKVFPDPIVTEIVPLVEFYAAEAHHQGYYRRNPNQGYCSAVIGPKVAKLRAKYAARLKRT